MDSKKIVEKINSKLVPSKWYDHLRIFLQSGDFVSIIEELKNKVEKDNQRFCPALNTAFKFLEDIEVEKVKAVILIDYTSNILETSKGIPLMGELVQHTPQNINSLLYSINKTKFVKVNKWVEQGVLIIPLAPTTRIGGQAHKKLWSPLIMRLLEVINKQHPDIPWSLVGSDTFKYYEDIISNNIRKVNIETPMKDTTWAQWINEILTKQGKPVIKW